MNSTIGLSREDIEYVRARYQQRIKTLGVSLASMNCGGESKQRLRHAVHAGLIRPDVSVLDVGCGVGQFYRHLLDSGFHGMYTGIDIVADYIEYCRVSFQSGQFELKNVFDHGLDGAYDVIVASQVFNARYPESDNTAVVLSFMERAFQVARVAVSIDMLSTYVDYEESHLHYFRPEIIFAHAKTLSRRVTLRHDYLPFEFTLQLFKANA